MKGNKKSYNSISGAELMSLYQRGDIEAFNCLYDKYKTMVYGYLIKRVNNRTDVDEIFQDVFLKLHQSRSRYKSEFPFKPWLFAVLRNSLVDYFRKKGKEYNDVPLDSLETNPSTLQYEDKHKINGLLPKDAGLNKNQRQAIELRYGEDFSFEEIAHRLETTSSNARQLVSRALKRLRKFIKPEDMI
ncbi:MAG: sigma-70 family RNA polymerase sigma factor [Desulfobacterales bacterium]|nr:sigma-70 family RNA polymerase sigma factor [Desulfobacterales bacterium]